MGNVDYTKAYEFFTDIVELFNSTILTDLHVVSCTIIYKLQCTEPINLYHIATTYNDYKNIRYESEIFPTLSLFFWLPTHVNVFATGKIVILGKYSTLNVNDIISWINKNIIL